MATSLFQGVEALQLAKEAGGAGLVFSHPLVDASTGVDGKPRGPLYIRSGASSIKWAYTLNTQSYPTIGGEVTQILSAFVGPMAIQGMTAGLATNQVNSLPAGKVKGWSGPNNYTPNHELKAIIDWFLVYMEVAGTTTRGNQLRNETAILFTYPARGWSFYIQVTGLAGFRYDRSVISPEWSIEAEIVSDNALNYFSGITMSSFTDDLITNQSVLGQIGLSAFENSGTEQNNPAFGQTGGQGSKDIFLNPTLGANANFLGAAQKMGDNFQSLLGAFASGTFADFGFGALEDNGSLPTNVDSIYQQIFGSPFIGSPGGSSSGQIASGSTTYNPSSTVPDQTWIDAVLKGLGAPTTSQNIAFMAGWGQIEGGGRSGTAANNWLNTSETMNEGETDFNSIGVKNYPTFAIGVAATVKTIQSTLYDDISSGLISGNPYTNPPLNGLGTWVDGPGGKNSAHAQKYAAEVMAVNATPVSGSNGQGTVDGGNAAALATKLLSFLGTKWIDQSQGETQMKLVAAGQQLTNPGGLKVSLDPRTIQVVLWLISQGYTVGTFAWCSDHSTNDGGSTGLGGHWGGLCVDISALNGIAINTSAAGQLVVTVDTLLRNAPAAIKPRQLISGGYGNVEYAACQALCLPSASYYGEPTLSEHTNHIHVGY